MVAVLHDKSRPAGGETAPMSLDGDTHIVTARTDATAHLADLDAQAENLRGRFVVQVTIEGDRHRTHVYRNAAAAERAVDRAKARGQRAHVTLVQMLPVGVVVGLGVER